MTIESGRIENLIFSELRPPNPKPTSQRLERQVDVQKRIIGVLETQLERSRAEAANLRAELKLLRR